MPTDLTDFDYINNLLKQAQEAEEDMRDQAKEAHLFVTKPDGQWEPDVWSAADGKPRYTFDMTSPIIDQVAGQIEDADFDIVVEPAGGDASEEVAETMDGIIRTIENMSDAKKIYSDAGRYCATAGIDGWRVEVDYYDDNSFDQDIRIVPVYNFQDRVWFDPSSQRKDRADAKYAWLLSALPKEQFEREYPEASPSSVSSSEDFEAYTDKVNSVTIGNFFWKKKIERTLLKMSNGAVYEADDEGFLQVRDELEAQGIVVVDERVRHDDVVYVRQFNADGWISEEQETPFSYIPIIPVYGNFKVIENKPVYFGIVQKTMDAQRVFNYSKSREVEETSLAPRAKITGTLKNVEGLFKDHYATLNTNNKPFLPYNPDPENPNGLGRIGGPEVNPGLQLVSTSMQALMQAAGGMFAASMGDNPNLQSGVAIEQLQDKGDNVTRKYISALEVAVRHTAKIILSAIPKVYSDERQIKLMGQDGTVEMVRINQVVIDQQTGQPVVLNDLTKGKYDVKCSAGKSYTSRQEETVQTILDIAKVDPSVIELGKDVLLNNIQSPGIKDIAARSRQQLLVAGLIPQDQMTDEELQQMQEAAQQPREPDAMMVAAEAEMAKAQADMEKVAFERERAQAELQVKAAQIQLDAEKVRLDREKAELAVAKDEMQLMLAEQKELREQVKSIVDNQNKMADTVAKLYGVTGADAVMDPAVIEAAHNTASEI